MKKSRFPRYERLLKLYPAEYRRAYGPQMLQTVEDMLDDHPSAGGRILTWGKIAVDLPVSVISIQARYTAATLLHDTPAGITRGSITSCVLLVPFFVSVIANALDRAVNHRDLYGSLLWHMPLLGVWVLWLPVAALLVSLASYSAYALSPTKRTWMARATDIRRVWTLAVPFVVAFGIIFLVFFHDSVHCWVQNPIYFATRFHQTYECSRNGSSFAW